MASISGANGVVYTTTNPQTQTVVNNAFVAAGTQYIPGGGTVTGQFVADNTAAATYVGSGTSVTGFLPDAPPNAPAIYQSGTATNSTIYASDKSSATIENTNPTGTLFGNFGAGGGAGVGLGLQNTFTTDPNSSASIAFGTLPSETVQANVFNSFGHDTVNITGPTLGQTQSNQINAYGPASDLVKLNSPGSLNFINNATGVSTVQGAPNSTLVVGGGGHTLLQAGSGGPDNLGVDTASGNVTLTGSTGGDSDTFTFMHATAGENSTGANEFVGNFNVNGANDAVVLQGYGANPYTAAVVNGSTVVTLSDKSTITFVGVSNSSTVTNAIRTT